MYSTRWFARWARKQGLTAACLCRAVVEMRQGQFEADLGSGLFKKRIARPGKGKSGGFRTLVASRTESLWFFLFGFSKNERSNIDRDELEALKSLATNLLRLTPRELALASDENELIEVNCHEHEKE